MAKKNSNLLTVEHNYTEEQIKSIKENLKKAFDIDYLPVELTMGNLLKKKNKASFDYIIGEQYVFYNPFENEEWGIGKQEWHLIEITYQRLDLVFFKIRSSKNPRKERYAHKDSIFVDKLIPINFSTERFGIPEKNLDLIGFDKTTNNPFDINITTPSKTFTI
jgi:hypothetical protein